MSSTVKFTIECEMEERWSDPFLSFLLYMEVNGKLGTSEIMGFYADGDGNFRPKFKFEQVGVDWNYKESKKMLVYNNLGAYKLTVPYWDAE